MNEQQVDALLEVLLNLTLEPGQEYSWKQDSVIVRLEAVGDRYVDGEASPSQRVRRFTIVLREQEMGGISDIDPDATPDPPDSTPRP